MQFRESRQRGVVRTASCSLGSGTGEIGCRDVWWSLEAEGQVEGLDRPGLGLSSSAHELSEWARRCSLLGLDFLI